MHTRTALITLALLLLSACGGSSPAPLSGEPLTATGTLVPAQLSRMHRGTHMLEINGENTYYVESSAIALQQYEGQIVGLHGVLSYNTDPKDLLVLKVDKVLQAPVQGNLLSLPDYKLSLTLPEGWIKTDGKDGVALSASGSLPVIIITKTNAMPEDGISLLLGGRTALRSLDADGNEQIVVDSPAGFVQIKTFPKVASGALISSASAILHSMRFSATAQTSSAAVPSGTGASLQPCGGPAGILCPGGSYCAITDSATNVGICRSLQKRN